MTNALSTLLARLTDLADNPISTEYFVPSLWTDPECREAGAVVCVDPAGFYRGKVEAILSGPDMTPASISSGGEWSSAAVVYNIFVRLTVAWDHDNDGRIDIHDDARGYRETGTFLKCIAILPYLQAMGINTIHLLPVTAIGRDGNKGTLGSPYAIRNPYKLDERLSEPFLGLDVETEFAAFVEAAHRLGMRVVAEFVFRTAAKDSDWIADHPNWFYWIDASVPDRDGSEENTNGYGNPQFSHDELKIINDRVNKNDTASLPPPPIHYRSMFAESPDEAGLVDGRYIGVSDDARTVRIPGAFADWPPDDVQPPWNDVTYLKLYDHPRFNYIAYNTIRFYDSRLAQTDLENRGLWNTIINIIPHYQRTYGIDGVMIDMGHALPKRLMHSIVERARKINPDFAFWEENFAITPKSRQQGYNATVGYLWSDEHLAGKLREFCSMLAASDLPVPYFATAENHNTPRAAARPGGMVFSRFAATINAFLPGLYFVHQGFELGETYPVNTGLGFTPEQIAQLPSHQLPLFSESALCWTNPGEISELIGKLMSLRYAWDLVVNSVRASSFELHGFSDERILCFSRKSSDGKYRITITANMDCERDVHARGLLPVDAFSVEDALTGNEIQLMDNVLEYCFRPGEVVVFELSERPK
jgi:glycosidase